MSIVGTLYNSSEFEVPFYWPNANEKPTMLPLPEGYMGGFADGINNSGQIVGSIYDDTASYPVIWTTPNAKPTKLPFLEGYVGGAAQGINNSGQIVGNNYRIREFNEYADLSTSIPVVWETMNEKPTRLPLFNEHVFGNATSINDLGQIVGYSNIEGPAYDSFPFIWTISNAMPIQLPFLDGYTHGQALSINNLGQIVGNNSKNDDTGFVQIYWEKYHEKPTQLPLFDGIVYGINNLGQFVGSNIIDIYSNNVIPVILADINTTPKPLQLPEGYTHGYANGISGVPAPVSAPVPAPVPVPAPAPSLRFVFRLVLTTEPSKVLST